MKLFYLCENLNLLYIIAHMSNIETPFNIQGFSPDKLCEKYQSPLFVYDAAKIEQQFNKLNDAFDVAQLKIKFACKALTNVNILSYLHSLGADIDTVSIEEIKLAMHAGIQPNHIFYTPNGVSFEEFQQAVELGVAVNIDNLSTLKKFGKAYGSSKPAFIRLNPHVLAGGNMKISTGHVNAKFGISIHQLNEVLEIVKEYDINIEGLHIHTGSDLLDADVFLKVADILFEAAKKFKNIKALDFGGGFKVAYKDGDIITDLNDLGPKFSKRFNDFCEEYGHDIALWFEPGKFLVSESGFFFSTVSVVKSTPTTTFVHVNTGLNHMIRPMFYDAYHHITNISNPEGKKKIYSIVGYICETDTFAWERPIAEIREGDILAFHNAGAYCYSMASNYNSRPRPAEVLIHHGKDYLIRERETFEDLIAKQSLVKLSD